MSLGAEKKFYSLVWRVHAVCVVEAAFLALQHSFKKKDCSLTHTSPFYRNWIEQASVWRMSLSGDGCLCQFSSALGNHKKDSFALLSMVAGLRIGALGWMGCHLVFLTFTRYLILHSERVLDQKFHQLGCTALLAITTLLKSRLLLTLPSSRSRI